MAGPVEIKSQIENVERFDVQIIGGGHRDAYPYQNAADSLWTLARWKEDRFKANYPDWNINVFKGDGVVAAPNATLQAIRDTYS